EADKIAKLTTYLPRSTDNSKEPVLLIAKLLSIPLENNLELSGLTPQQIKNRTISTLVDMILAFSFQRPTLCIFEDAHWLDPSTLRVPDTLSDALMERIDRVAPSRRLAQIAAVIGREFSYDLLSAASQIDDDDILSALSLLEQADIIYRVGISPFLRFAFKHALLCDAIYDSLLRSKRQQIHADIAAILGHDISGLAENQPQVLAYHYQEAGDHQHAIRCWFGSG